MTIQPYCTNPGAPLTSHNNVPFNLHIEAFILRNSVSNLRKIEHSWGFAILRLLGFTFWAV